MTLKRTNPDTSISTKSNSLPRASLIPARNSRTQQTGWFFDVQSGLYNTKIYVCRSAIETKNYFKNFLPNGSLHVINLLMKPRNLNILKYIHLQPLFNIPHWKAVRDQLTTSRKCLRSCFSTRFLFIH